MSGTGTVMDYETIFDYEAQPKQTVDACNLCGRAAFGGPRFDRYGYLLGATTCLACGLVYLSPHMTAEAYHQFYESGAYRRLVSAYHGREINAETIRGEQAVYAGELCDFLAPHVERQELWNVAHRMAAIGRLLDVGGSTGVVARRVAERFGLDATVVDPAARELAHAEHLHRVLGDAESFQPEGEYTLITLCQTIDHLLDPMGVLKKLRGCLSEKGLLFVDAVDYDVTRQIKIDHPYNFTEATMAEMLKRAGFREVARERAPDGVHVRFLCER